MSHLHVSVVSLFLTAALPVVNVFCMCAVGAALARKGILDGRARHLLSQLVFWVFVPAFTFTHLADSVNLRNLAVWWFLPVNMIISISIGLVIGWIFARLLKVDPWFSNHFMCSCALGNVGNLPLVLVSSVCDADTPFAAALGPKCEQLGVAYIAFEMWIASTFQYCIAYNLMGAPSKDSHHLEAAKQVDNSAELVVQIANVPEDVRLISGQPTDSQDDAKAGSRALAGRESRPDALSKACDQPSELVSHGTAEKRRDERPQKDGRPQQFDGRSAYQAETEKDEGESLLPQIQASNRTMTDVSSPFSVEEPSTTGRKRRWEKHKEIHSWLKGISWGRYLNCPTLAAIAGLTVGCISILKRLLFGNSPPLIFVTQSLRTMSDGIIPCMMLILGGSLGQGPGRSKLPLRVTLGTVAVRLVIIPALGTGLVFVLIWIGIIKPPDILFTLTLFLCHATPTAMNLQTVATLNGSGEAELSTLLCWQYLTSLVTLPLWMLLFVFLISRAL